MTERPESSPSPGGAPLEAAASAAGSFDVGWEGHRRRQLVAGLALTPAERLRWLEETMQTMRRWCGRAAHGRPVGDVPPAGGPPAAS